MKSIIILLITITFVAKAADSGDWVDPSRLPIPFQVRGFYGGYLEIGPSKALYYIYTPSNNNPSKDPLVVLLSPGPGCSALHSWLYSKGQFTFTRNTSNFRLNPKGWNRQANVLYIEGPAGTGFSYGSDANISDNSTQNEYFRGILRFY